MNWAWIKDAPSHQLNVVCSTLMAILTGLVLLVCFVLERKPDPYLVGLWLTFLGAWKGINYKQFAAKRETEFAKPGEVMARNAVPQTSSGGS